MALTITELNAVTRKHLLGDITSQVYDTSPFTAKLKADNQVKVSGGSSLQWPVRYKKLGSAGVTTARAQVSFQSVETRTAAIGSWAYQDAVTMMHWDERATNKGPEAIVNLAKDKIDELKEDFADYMVDRFVEKIPVKKTKISEGSKGGGLSFSFNGRDYKKTNWGSVEPINKEQEIFENPGAIENSVPKKYYVTAETGWTPSEAKKILIQSKSNRKTKSDFNTNKVIWIKEGNKNVPYLYGDVVQDNLEPNKTTFRGTTKLPFEEYRTYYKEEDRAWIDSNTDLLNGVTPQKPAGKKTAKQSTTGTSYLNFGNKK